MGCVASDETRMTNDEFMKPIFLPAPPYRLRLNAEVYRIFAPGVHTALNADAAVLPEWIQLAPYGSWPTSERDEHGQPEAVQVFDADGARDLVSRFNALHRRLFRLARLNSCKVYVGHPDFAPEVWPERVEVADVVELSFDAEGLNGRMRWNTDVLDIVRKNKFPSVAWDTQVTGQGQEKPVMLWSVGMWHRPNIKDVRSVINALPDANPEPDPETKPEDKPAMNILAQIKALLKKAGLLQDTDSDETLLGALGSLISTIGWKREEEARQVEMNKELKTALNAQADKPLGEFVTDLITAHATLQTAATDRETRLNAAAAETTTLNERINALTTERDALRTGDNARINAIMELLIQTGRVTKAEEEAARTRLNAEFGTAIAELLQAPSKLGGKPLNIGGTRPAIAEAQERMARINAWTDEYMVKKSVGYDEAYKAAEAAPELKPLFAAMKPAAAE
jgi:hypothetical protein